ncbi:MAG: clan AA aspartic protease [Spirochaetales bacterium]|nr:clan AA aspartic protease [Spirochaetales bacterium]
MFKFTKSRYSALYSENPNGLARAVITPAKIRIPLIFTNLKHDFFETGALWDTGATNTVISVKLAQELGLPTTGKAKTRGVHGENVVNTHLIDILLMDSVLFPTWQVSAGIIDPDNRGIGLLIGMDIISLGDFALTHNGDNTAFSFLVPHLEEPVDYRTSLEKHGKERKRKTVNAQDRRAYNATVKRKKKKRR